MTATTKTHPVAATVPTFRVWPQLCLAVLWTVFAVLVTPASAAPRDQQATAPLTAAEKIEPLRYPFAHETAEQRAHRMAWWHEAKFGLFIHWGLYAAPGDGEWHMRNRKKSFADYARLASTFNPVKFDADEWMAVAQEAGMKYLVFTAKHHDGFALFDSKASDYNIVKATPFKRDPLKELAVAAPKHGIRMGVYYSHLADWGHPGGGAGEPHWDPAHQNGDTDEYLNKIAVPQVKELLENYGPIAEFWFDNDGAKGMTTARANRFFDLFKAQPQVVLNPRLIQGDFATQEQRISPLRPTGDWEACLTINGSWGYRAVPAKSTQVLLQKMVDVWGKGGNVLLNVGPQADGAFPADSVARLRDLGAWLRVNGESIYGSTEGPFAYLPWGRATRKGTTVYLHVFQWPSDGVLEVPLTTPVKRAYLLAARDATLATTTRGDRLLLQLPAQTPDANVSVIAVELTTLPPRQEALSFKKPVTADTDNAHAANAVDKDPYTRWRFAKGATKGTLTVDLLAPQPINTLRTGFSQYGQIRSFALEYLDGDTWKSALNATNMAADEDVRTFPVVTAQHVRLRITEASGEIIFGSFELFGP